MTAIAERRSPNPNQGAPGIWMEKLPTMSIEFAKKFLYIFGRVLMIVRDCATHWGLLSCQGKLQNIGSKQM